MFLKIVTYNIHCCIGSDHKKNPQRIGEVLREIAPDIIALQEVESASTVDEIGLLSENQPFNTVLGPTFSLRSSHYGNVLLSRFPILAERKINLSYPGREKRGAIDVDIDCHGNVARVIATHLGLAPVERRHQVKILLENIVDPRLNKPLTVLMGDMNEWFLWGRPLRWIHQYFGYSPSIPTYPARCPLFSLDRIWCHPPNVIGNIERSQAGCAEIASDHLPLSGMVNTRLLGPPK